MKNIRLLLSSLAVLGLLGFALAMPGRATYAQAACNDNDPGTKCNVLDPVCASTPNATVCQENQTDQDLNNNSLYGPNGIITKAVRLISILVGIAAVIMIIVGGLKYVTSNGDTASVNNAKNTILYAIVGLVVALTAQAIIVFVVTKL